MSIYMCVYIPVYIYMYIYRYIYVCIPVYIMPTHTHIYTHTYMHVQACRRGDIKGATFLLKRGSLVSALNNNGDTPLHEAARGGYGDVVDAVTALSDVEGVMEATNKGGETPAGLLALAYVYSVYICVCVRVCE